MSFENEWSAISELGEAITGILEARKLIEDLAKRVEKIEARLSSVAWPDDMDVGLPANSYELYRDST